MLLPRSPNQVSMMLVLLCIDRKCHNSASSTLFYCKTVPKSCQVKSFHITNFWTLLSTFNAISHYQTHLYMFYIDFFRHYFSFGKNLFVYVYVCVNTISVKVIFLRHHHLHRLWHLYLNLFPEFDLNL